MSDCDEPPTPGIFGELQALIGACNRPAGHEGNHFSGAIDRYWPQGMSR